MAHLIAYVGKRNARMDAEAAEGMPQIMKADRAEHGGFEQGLEDRLGKIVHLNERPCFGSQDEVLRNVLPAFAESFELSLIVQLQENASQLGAHVHAPPVAILRRQHHSGLAVVIAGPKMHIAPLKTSEFPSRKPAGTG